MSDFIDICVRGAEKQKFRVAKYPEEKFIYLNTSDTGIVERLESAYNELLALGNQAVEIKSEDIDINSEESKALFAQLADIDAKMRDIVNTVFDSDVAEACSGGGKMYDPVDGMFRFEAILDDLMQFIKPYLEKAFEEVNTYREELTKKYREG